MVTIIYTPLNIYNCIHLDIGIDYKTVGAHFRLLQIVNFTEAYVHAGERCKYFK